MGRRKGADILVMLRSASLLAVPFDAPFSSVPLSLRPGRTEIWQRELRKPAAASSRCSPSTIPRLPVLGGALVRWRRAKPSLRADLQALADIGLLHSAGQTTAGASPRGLPGAVRPTQNGPFSRKGLAPPKVQRSRRTQGVYLLGNSITPSRRRR